jgi:hypothetical protein
MIGSGQPQDQKGEYMAGKKPSFITGANAKIKVDGKTFAYASDVSYQVVVDTIPIETMGRYEAVTNEPVNYSVAGELSVVRYTNIAYDGGMPGTSQKGNGLGNATFSSGSGNRSYEINPGNLLLSKTWDLAVYQKTQTSETAGGETASIDNALVEFITIKDCRFTRKSAALNKRGVLVDRLSFVGILADDESFDASYSGDTDLQ